MKKIVLILLVAAFTAAVAVPALAGEPEWAVMARNARNGHRVDGYSYYPNGYYPNGYYYSYGPPGSPDVDVRVRESWGERSYDQTPNLPAKIIDAGTILGVIFLIFR
jgi:hypothetical protein